MENEQTTDNQIRGNTSDESAEIKGTTLLEKKKKAFKDSYFFLGAVIVQLVIIIGFIILTVHSAAAAKDLSVPLSSWQSKKIEYSDGSWYADEETVPTDEKINLIYGPYIHMDKGSYLVTVDYDCETEQSVTATAGQDMGVFIKTGTARLYKNLHSVSFRVQVKEPVERFEVIVNYDGLGSIQINNITIREDYAGYSRMLAYFFVLFLILDSVYIFYDKLKKNRETVFFIVGIAFLASIPLLYPGIGDGHDIDVHFMRIEGIATELMRGVFPVRIASDWIEGYGYPASVYYGDVLLYIPAVLRIMGFSVVTSYKVYIFLINLGTSIIGYYSFKGIFGSRSYGLVASLAYTTASYRLTNIYIRSAVGEFSASMFIPLIALAVYGLYTGDAKDKRSYRKNSLLLAIGMTGLITSHILSTEMVVIILAILSLILAVYTFKPAVLKGFALAVVETILIGCSFIVPFLDYYFNVSVRINDTVAEMDTGNIQSNGVKIAEYFAFFRDPFSGGLSHHLNHRMLHTPGLVLMLALLAALYFIISGKIQKKSGFLYIYLGFSLITLYMASDQFPWDVLSLQPGLGNMLAQIQFPWRYVSISAIFLTLLLCSVLQVIGSQDHKTEAKYMKLVVLLCFIMTTFFTCDYLDDTYFVDYYNGTDLNTCAVGQGEYMRSYAYYGEIDGMIKLDNVTTASILERSGCHMAIECEGSSVDGFITLPVFNYKGYTAVDENGRSFELLDGYNDQIMIPIPEKYSGIITLDFKEPLLWRAAEIISLLSILFFVFRNKLFSEKKTAVKSSDSSEKSSEK